MCIRDRGDPTAIRTIAEQFAAQGVDVIVPIATGAAQGAAAAAQNVPIVFSEMCIRDRYYIKLEGEEPVYTVSESFAAAFTRTERGLQQTENWPVESTDSVTRATLEQGGNTLTVDVSEDADGNKTYTASDTARTCLLYTSRCV